MNNEHPDDYATPDQEAAMEEAIQHRMDEREEAAIARSKAWLAQILGEAG